MARTTSQCQILKEPIQKLLVKAQRERSAPRHRGEERHFIAMGHRVVELHMVLIHSDTNDGEVRKGGGVAGGAASKPMDQFTDVSYARTQGHDFFTNTDLRT